MKKILLTSVSLFLMFMASNANATALVTDNPIPWAATQIDQQPVTNYTPTSWSSTVISNYTAAFTGPDISVNQNIFTPGYFVINSASPSETVYTQTLSWGSWTVANVPVPTSLITLIAARTLLGDTDNSFCLYDTATGIVYSGTGVTANTSTHVLSVTAGGAFLAAGATGWWDIGYPNNNTTKSPAGPQLGGGSGHTCTGIIGLTETQNNTINHALRFAWPATYTRGNTELPQYVYPATATDGTGTHGVTNDAPYGARLVVDPTLTDSYLTTTYSFNSSDLAIIHALQKYGAYLSDTDGSSAMALQAIATGQNGVNVYGFSSNFTAAFMSAHMWFVNEPFPEPLDNRFTHNYFNQ